MNFKKLFDYSQPLVAAMTVLVIGLILIMVYAANVVRDIALSGDTIEVTGSAKVAVVADMGRLNLQIEVKTGLTGQADGTALAEATVDKVKSYLSAQGLTEYETPAGSINANYYYPQNAEPVQTGYSIMRSVVVRSLDVSKLTELANDLGPLSGNGYIISNGGLELTYSKLDAVRIELLTDAIKDATARANAIAENSGRTVGELRNAVGGVVQVLPAGGVDISDYGSYDTASLNKDIMVTTRATFGLK